MKIRIQFDPSAVHDARMAMDADTFQTLHGALRAMWEAHQSTIRAREDFGPPYSDTRNRWDLMWLCVDKGLFPYPKGLADAHMDTALRRILPPFTTHDP